MQMRRVRHGPNCGQLGFVVEAVFESKVRREIESRSQRTEGGEVMALGEQLASFYHTWTQKLEYAMDESNPREKRIEAMNWVDRAVGGELTTDATLDSICLELRELDPPC
jgi:hypothetical protein